jgi:thymidylate synthase (FAD)
LIEYTSEVKATLIDSLASDIDVARAAWVSNYGEEAREKDPSAIEGLIRYLYNNKHMSPFEHGIFKFYIDCPIFVAREFMRHRTFSFNEVSGRYKKLDGRFYVPSNERPLVQEGKVGAYTFVAGTNSQYARARRQMESAYEMSWHAYEDMLEAGIAKEVARDVLPVSTMTQFYASVDPRNLMQFLTLRNDKHALYEIRQIAIQMEAALEVCMPLTYKAYVTARDKAEMDRTPASSKPDVIHVQGDATARAIYPENYKIESLDSKTLDGKPLLAGGTITTGTLRAQEPEWAIDSYVPKHRAGDTYNITINIPEGFDAKKTAQEVADLVQRTDRYGRRKLEK